MATLNQIAPLTRLKIEKIAVLTDFSKNADTALQFAAALARGYNASLVLAHAYIPPYAAFAAPEANLVYQTFHDLTEELNERLAIQTEADSLRNIKVSTVLQEGSATELLAALRDIDLVVVGTSGQTGLEKAALGSTAEAIFRSSPVPVLTVGPRCRCTSPETVLKTILYATDFSPGAKLSLPYASSIANEHGAKLILLHVSNDKEAEFSFERTIASIKPLEKLNELIGKELDKFIAESADANFTVMCKVGFGKPETVIVEEAMKAKADLVVIGARGAGAFASVLSHFGGGTAYHVAANADCPVLTIRGH